MKGSARNLPPTTILTLLVKVAPSERRKLGAFLGRERHQQTGASRSANRGFSNVARDRENVDSSGACARSGQRGKKEKNAEQHSFQMVCRLHSI